MAHEAGQKNPPPPPFKKRLMSILTMIVGRENKWDHQLGCEFQSSRYVNLCLKGALINYLLIYLIYTQRACGARVASVTLTYTRERENVFIVIARACIAYLSRWTHSVT